MNQKIKYYDEIMCTCLQRQVCLAANKFFIGKDCPKQKYHERLILEGRHEFVIMRREYFRKALHLDEHVKETREKLMKISIKIDELLEEFEKGLAHRNYNSSDGSEESE